MFKIKLIPALLLAVFLICGGGVADNTAHAQTLTFVNYTGQDIYSLYISNANAPGFGGDDLLGNKVISNNSSYSLNVPSNLDHIKMKVVLRNGRDWYWYDINAKSLWRVTFTRNGSKIRANWN